MFLILILLGIDKVQQEHNTNLKSVTRSPLQVVGEITFFQF